MPSVDVQIFYIRLTSSSNRTSPRAYLMSGDDRPHIAVFLSRGSKDIGMNVANQFKLNPNFRMLSLQCTGTEEHIYDCQKNTQETCKVVGKYVPTDRSTENCVS